MRTQKRRETELVSRRFCVSSVTLCHSIFVLSSVPAAGVFCAFRFIVFFQ